MDNKYSKVHYSQVDPNALSEELVKKYHLQEPVKCLLFRKGMSENLFGKYLFINRL